MAMRSAPKIQPGDRVTKAGDPSGKIWDVVDVRVATDGILHARLKASGRQDGAMTISAEVLMDRRFWQMAPEK